jgi:subtilisin-like proprotein convertase family protein
MKNLLFYLCVLLIISFTNLSAQTDEYGNNGSNKVLSGLGLSLSYVNVLNGFNFDSDSSGTIEAWIYPNSTFATPRTIISKGASTNVSFLFGININSKLYFRIGNTDFVNADGQSININSWTHIAVTWTGKPNYSVQFYLNGVLSGTAVNSSAAWVSSNDQVRIGSSQSFTSQSFSGYIDEVKFYKNNISAGHILMNRFCGIGDYYIGTPADLNASYAYKNLYSSWTFNQTGSTAFEYVNSNSGFYMGSAISFGPVYGNPVPYNLALKFGGGINDYITIPTNTVFDQYTDGTFEFWFKPNAVNSEQILISKAASGSNISFLLGLNNSGKLYFALGNYLALNSSGESIEANKWNHIAVAWTTSGNNYIISFYKNGKLNGTTSTIIKAYNTNTSPVLIGNSSFQNIPANGFIDELRLWQAALTPAQINSYMFVSTKSISNAALLVAYNFDGTLQNFSATTSSTGTFNNNATNYSRFSAYSNDSIGGAFNSSFISHSTTINRNNQPNTFPNNYFLRNPFLTIPDNNPVGISDSINYTGTFGTVSAVELFLALDHTYLGDLIISLTAPNGTTKNVTANTAGSSKNILSFFNDAFDQSVTSTVYLPPWGFVKPLQAFGNFSSSTAQGYWKIKCVDNAGNDIGVLKGWGLKFDVVSSGNNNSNVLPKEFKLFQNYPNPFNNTTRISYDVPKSTLLSITVYDISGKEVAQLVNKVHEAGSYNINYNTGNLSSGVYFYSIKSDAYNKTQKMILLK